jgi:hypothetical protein
MDCVQSRRATVLASDSESESESVGRLTTVRPGLALIKSTNFKSSCPGSDSDQRPLHRDGQPRTEWDARMPQMPETAAFEGSDRPGIRDRPEIA